MTGNGSVKLRALTARLSRPFKDDLFKRVIDGMDTLPRVHAAALEATFPEDTLPSSASRRAGLHWAFGEDEGVLVVLACWVELNATLRSEVQGYLVAGPPPKDGSDLIKWAYEFGTTRFKRNQTKQVEGAIMALWQLDLHRRADELLASFDPGDDADASANDIEDSEHGSDGDELAEATALDDRLRALLESEPAESAFWDRPEAFREAFDTIAAHKFASRTSSRRRGEVGESLARLAEEYCEELEYVECTRGPRDFSQVAESELDTIESGVRALEEALRSFRSLSATRPRLIREEREWHLRRDQLATSIARLSVALYGPADEAAPPDDPGGSAPLSGPGNDQPLTEPAMVTDDKAITITSPVTDSEAVHTTGEDAARDSQHPEATALGGDDPTPGRAGAAVEPVEAKVPTSPDRHDDGPAVDAPAVAMPAPATSTPPAAVPTTAARGPVDRDAQLVARIALGDVPGAYWVARAAEASSLQPLVASRVLAVVEAWPLVDHTDSAAVSEVADLLRSFEPATPFEAFAVTCALLPLLPRVRQGLIDVSVAPWLEPSDDYRFLRMVVDPVRDFHQRGLAITAGALDPTMTGEQARENLREAADQCKALLAKSRKHTPSFARAKEVWQTLLDTELTRLLEPAAHNRRNERATVLAAIRDLGTREDRMNRFNDLAATLPGRRVPAIVGESRNQLARWTEEAIQHAQAWLDAERALEGKEEASNGYLAQRCRDLQHDVQTHLGEAQRHCTELLESPSPADRAAGRLAAKTLSALAGSLRLADGGSPAHDPLRALADPPESLHGRLSARLLFCPGVRLSDQRGVAPEQLDGAAALLSGQPWPADPEAAADGWIAQRDFRWVSLLTRGVAPEAAEKILARSRSAEEDARAELATRVRQLDTEVERAVVDGVVAQDYRSLPVFVPYGNLAAIGGDLGRHLQELSMEIARVAERRADIVARKRESWAHARQDMVRSGWPQASEVTRLVEQAFDRQDLRLIDEYLATLPRRVKLLQEAPPHWFEEHGPRHLRAFAAAAGTATTPEPDGDSKLIKAWNDLSRAGRVSRTSQVHGPLGDILAALGFRLQSSGASFTRQHDERGWT
ncbi:MAG: hypothetical protein JNM38_13365, partial [Acidobacteria bacterium]|nr:hypothetical protein [Acidobacteriota bacterium]